MTSLQFFSLGNLPQFTASQALKAAGDEEGAVFVHQRDCVLPGQAIPAARGVVNDDAASRLVDEPLPHLPFNRSRPLRQFHRTQRAGAAGDRFSGPPSRSSCSMPSSAISARASRTEAVPSARPRQTSASQTAGSAHCRSSSARTSVRRADSSTQAVAMASSKRSRSISGASFGSVIEAPLSGTMPAAASAERRSPSSAERPTNFGLSLS